MNPVFCALDTTDLTKADKLIEAVRPNVGGLKLGLEFFLAHGSHGYRAIADKGLPIFLDLKLHDIPNTVAGGLSSLLSLEPAFVTVHATGGRTMMEMAAAAALKASGARPKILAVTVLTSMDTEDLGATGQDTDTERQVVRLARLAKESGMDGVICSPEEIVPLRQSLGPNFILMVPGIRPSWSKADDQKRTMAPREAKQAGANYLVIGRPITTATDPAEAALKIAMELS